MANIRFNLESDRNGAQMYITLIYDISRGNRLKMSVREKVDPSMWCKRSQRVLSAHRNHIQINTILNNLAMTVEKIRLRYKVMQQEPPARAFKVELRKIIAPDIEHSIASPQKYDQRSYFDKFYDIVGHHINFKEAYYEVENEWNESGVYMFPTYDSFRVGKMRFLKKHLKSRTKTAKGLY